MIHHRLLSSALCLSAALGGFGHAAAARTLTVGPGQAYRTPSEAAAFVRDGDQVKIAPGTYTDCAVWRANNLTIEGTAPNAGVVVRGPTCAGKGLFVTDGNDITIRNLTLTGARDNDNNGAGIRGEGINLTVDGVKFLDNQEGILAATSGPSRILVRNSTFSGNGTCVSACAHAIYVGSVNVLRVEHSVFRDTMEGHHIKSRARLTEVIDCDISDTKEGTASHLIDIPNGGNVTIRGNKLEKGPNSQNHLAAIRIGEEGASNPTQQIVIEDNEFKNAGSHETAFVWNDTNTPAVVRHNRISGDVIALHGDGDAE